MLANGCVSQSLMVIAPVEEAEVSTRGDLLGTQVQVLCTDFSKLNKVDE